MSREHVVTHSNALSRKTRDRFFLRALFKPHHASDTTSISSTIKTLLQYERVKQDSDLVQRLKNGLQRQQEITRLNEEILELQTQLAKAPRPLQGNNNAIYNQQLRSKLKQNQRLKMISQTTVMDLYRSLEGCPERDVWVSLTGVSPETLSQYLASLDAKSQPTKQTTEKVLIKDSTHSSDNVAPAVSHSHDDLLNSLKLIVKKIKDEGFENDLLNIFKIKLKIAAIVNENLKENHDKLQKLMKEKKEVSKRDEKEATAIYKKSQKNAGDDSVISINLAQGGLEVQRINKSIYALQQQGTHGLAAQLSQYLQKNPPLNDLWHELTRIYNGLPVGALKQSLHDLMTPKTTSETAELVFQKRWDALCQQVANPDAAALSQANKIPRGSVTSTVQEKTGSQAKQSNEQTSLVQRAFNGVVNGLKAFYRWVTAPSSPERQRPVASVVTTVHEDESAAATTSTHVAPKPTPAPNQWLSDNLPPASANWVSRALVRMSTLLGLSNKPAVVASPVDKAGVKREQDLLVAVDKLIRAQALSHTKDMDAYLKQCQHLLVEFKKVPAPSPASLEAIHQLKVMTEATLQQRSSVKPTTSADTDVNHVSLSQTPKQKR